ncbi:MAG: hypothetical protein KDJ29_00750 [Hyphomicrobiales bacterium]|nr:hypothetical protein [Hyphomicrobiales bacterium]
MQYLQEKTNPAGEVEMLIAIEDLRRIWNAPDVSLDAIKQMLKDRGCPVVHTDINGLEYVVGHYPAVSLALH